MLLAITGSAHSQLPSPELQAVYPPMAKAGTTVELSVEGLNLDGLKSLLFTIPNVKAVPVILPKNEFRKHPRQKGKSFSVTIPANAPVGLCELRCVSYYGVSNPKILTILGSGEKLNSTAGTHDLKSAPELKIGEHAFGKFDANQIDFFRFTAKKGQAVTVRCTAEFIDSTGDATLVIQDGAGTTLASNRDFNYRDPLIDFTPPADGNYWIGVHDFTYTAGGTYHLELTSTPVIDAVFPPFGKAGTTQKFTLYGHNFPGGKKLMEVSIPVPTSGDFALSPASPLNGILPAFSWHYQKTPAAARIGISDLAPVLRQAKPGPQKIKIPSEIAGRFTPKENSHQFRFTGKKGSSYFLQVVGDAIQGQVDPCLVVEKIGKAKDGSETFSVVKESDDLSLQTSMSFPNRSRDPQMIFAADADTEYQITVIDQFGAMGKYPFYRMSIRVAQPDYELIASVERPVFDKKYVHLASPVLRCGGVFPFKILAVKKGGLDVPITVSAEGLPAGVTANPVTIPAGSDSAFLVLKADAKAAAWSGAIQIRGKAKSGNKEIVRKARSASVVASVKDGTKARVRTRLETEIVVSVIDAENAPVVITTDVSKPLSVVIGQKLEIPVTLEGKTNLKGNFVIDPVGLTGLKKPPVLTLAADKNGGKLTIPFINGGSFMVKEGTYTFILRGKGTVSKFRHYLPSLDQAKENQKHLDALLKIVTDKAKKAEGEKTKKEIAIELANATKLTKEKDLQFAVFSQPITVVVKPVPKPVAAKK